MTGSATADILAFLAALAFAVANVLQQKGTLEAPAGGHILMVPPSMPPGAGRG